MGNPIVLLSAAALFILAVLAVVLYLFYYRSKINRRLTDRTNTGKTRLWSPMRACLTAVIGALAIFAVICLIFAASGLAPAAPAPAAYHAQILSPEEMKNGYLSKYSIKENAGYTKQEKVIDDVKYTCFISAEGTDALHPAFLIYAEYVGEGTPKYHDVNVSFQTFEGQGTASTTVGGCEVKDTTVCIVGNAFFDSNISCIVDFYNDQREEFNLEKLKEENTPLVISIPVR